MIFHHHIPEKPTHGSGSTHPGFLIDPIDIGLGEHLSRFIQGFQIHHQGDEDVSQQNWIIGRQCIQLGLGDVRSIQGIEGPPD